MQRLIAFTAPLQSGKTTAANHLVSQYGYVRASFADPLRAMLAALGLTPHEFQAGKEQPCDLLGGKTPRFAMQTLGTEWGRNTIYEDLWVSALERSLRDRLTNHSSVRFVIDDCRFDNEAMMVRRLGGLVIRIERAKAPRPGAHLSEAGVSSSLVDFCVNNRDDAEFFADIDCLAQ